MAATFDEVKRNELINLVGNYFVYESSVSYRKCMNYLESLGNSISVPTIKSYLEIFIKNNPGLGEYILDKISVNIPKTVDDDVVRQRVIKVSNLIASGMMVEEVSNLTGITKDTIYRDVTYRIFKIDDKLGHKVKSVLEKHSLDNLKHGNDTYLNQERNSNGTFKK